MALRRVVVLSLSTLAGAVVLPTGAAAAPAEFASAGEFEAGSTPYDIATGDFNDDGVVDVATPNANSSNVSIFLGDGDGTFTEAPESPIATGSSPLGAAAGDFDGDGFDDVAVVENADDRLRVLLSDGDGTFTQATGSPVSVGPDPRKVTVGLLDAGPTLDVAVVNSNTGGEGNGSVSVLLGAGDGSFSAAPSSPVAVGLWPVDVVAAFLDGDEGLDLAVTNNGSDDVSILSGSSTGTFTAAESTEAVGDGPWNLAAAHLSSDGHMDLATGNAFSENVSVLLGSATGDFTQPATSPEPEGDQAVAAADFDGDGDVDLTSNQSASELSILLNDASGAFEPASSSPVEAFNLISTVDHADTDGDGDQDILAVGGNGSYYALMSFLNDETDSDGDGFLDLADKCPVVAGTVTGCPITYRLATLRYKHAAETFKGRLSFNPGGAEEPSCLGPGVKVKILRFTNSGVERVGTTTTNAKGRFKLAEKVKRGRFQARAPRSLDPATGICQEIGSPVLQVTPPDDA